MYKLIQDMVENGTPMDQALAFANANFGTNFTAPPTGSTNLYSGRTLHR